MSDKETSPDLVFRAISDIRTMVKTLFEGFQEMTAEMREGRTLAERRMHNVENIVILHEDAIGALRERLEILEKHASTNGEEVV